MKKILIADDDSEVVESIRVMLSPYYSVETATTGLEVLELFDDNNYHGLIIDVDFSYGISGLQTAAKLRLKDKTLRILVFSATDYSDAVRQYAVDMGATFCEKPLKLSQVQRIMDF